MARVVLLRSGFRKANQCKARNLTKMSRTLIGITLVFMLTLHAQTPVDLPVEHPECSAFSTERGTLTPKQNGAKQALELSNLTVRVSRQLVPRDSKEQAADATPSNLIDEATVDHLCGRGRQRRACTGSDRCHGFGYGRLWLVGAALCEAGGCRGNDLLGHGHRLDDRAV